MDYTKAKGNKIFETISQKSESQANAPIIIEISLEEIDPNPDNETIFNMNDIDRLATVIRTQGFSGAIDVFKKPDGRYEISSGHRRYYAMKEIGEKTIPCLVSSMPSDIQRASKLLTSNIHNRQMTPMDYANALAYYIEHVVEPRNAELKNQGEKKLSTIDECMNFFGCSRAQYFRWSRLNSLIPELQEMVKEIDFPYTAIVDENLSEEEQKEVLEKIIAEKEKYPDATLQKNTLSGFVDKAKKKEEAPKPTTPNKGIVLEDLEDENDELEELEEFDVSKFPDAPSEEDLSLKPILENPVNIRENATQKISIDDYVSKVAKYLEEMSELIKDIEIEDKETFNKNTKIIEDFFWTLKNQ